MVSSGRWGSAGGGFSTNGAGEPSYGGEGGSAYLGGGAVGGYIAGGGGSFNSGSNQDNAAGARSGDGLVTITPL